MASENSLSVDLVEFALRTTAHPVTAATQARIVRYGRTETTSPDAMPAFSTPVLDKVPIGAANFERDDRLSADLPSDCQAVGRNVER